MQKVPLGMDEETYENRNTNSLTKHSSWKKGFKTGKKSFKKRERPQNPYTLPSDIWELLRKRTRWELGFDEGWAYEKAKHQRRRDKHEQLKRIKEISKKKKKKHHHGKH